MATTDRPRQNGGRLLKDPQFFASSRDLITPERSMALLREMTICWLGYAAFADRIRQALQTPHATFPNPQADIPHSPRHFYE
jgi:hypothetical protein